MSAGYQTHVRGRRYVRLTFRPAGATRRRTIWALQESERCYRRVNRDGSIWQRETSTTVQEEVVLVTPTKATVRPAGVSLQYGTLEVLD